MVGKRGVIFGFVLAFAIAYIGFASAVGVSVTEINSTLARVSISNAVDLYSYEVNFDYDGTINGVSFYDFLASDGASTTKGSSTRSGILSAYESRLDNNQQGIDGSGNLFNVTHSGDLELRFALFIDTDGGEEYVYYNGSDGGGSEGGGGSGGGGGGGSGTAFSVDKTKIDVNLKQGDTKTETFTITNDGKKDLPFKISTEELNGYLIFDETSFVVLAGQSKTVNMDFFTSENEGPNVYTGRINIESGSIKSVINVILEIIERYPLFDISAILDKDQFLIADEINAKIKMVNIGDFDKVDVTLKYSIKNFEDYELRLGEETVGVGRELEIERKFNLPDSFSQGEYVFIVKLIDHDGKIATGVYPFTITGGAYSPSFFKNNLIYFAVVGVIIFLIIVVSVIFIRRKNRL